MSVACARRNESQASSPLALGNSRATSRARRPAVSDCDGTCIRNNLSVECLQSQVYPRRLGRTKGATKPMSTPILTVAPAGTWNLDRIHSRVDFEVRYLAGTFKSEFQEVGTELTVD